MPLDDQDEIFYLVDKNDKVLGSIKRKNAHLDKSKIHRAVGVFVINEKNEMLMQKRSHKKDISPGEWTIASSGHVTFGQSFDTASQRELEEELGIKGQLEYITKAIVKTKKETELISLYKIKVPSNTNIVLDKDEVEKVKWVKLANLKKFIKSNSIADGTLAELKAAGYL